MDIFNLGEAILSLLEVVFGFWNGQVNMVFELLGQSPTSFKGGGPWGVITGIEPIFVAGCFIFCDWFLFGKCRCAGRDAV